MLRNPHILPTYLIFLSIFLKRDNFTYEINDLKKYIMLTDKIILELQCNMVKSNGFSRGFCHDCNEIINLGLLVIIFHKSENRIIHAHMPQVIITLLFILVFFFLS